MPITKYSFIVKMTKLADTIRKAFRIAKTGRPGPVLVDIPKILRLKNGIYSGRIGKMHKGRFLEKNSEDG